MSDYFLGEIRWFPFDWAPKGWLPCDGRSLPVNQNQALYAVLGNKYGGNNVNFNLPDLRGRTSVHADSTKPEYALGAIGGAEAVTLSLAQMPAHDHDLQATTVVGINPVPRNNILARPQATAGVSDPALYGVPATAGASRIPLNPGSVSVSGSGIAHENMQPFLVLNPCIATSGIFPTNY